jgi:hypothetical protein
MAQPPLRGRVARCGTVLALFLRLRGHHPEGEFIWVAVGGEFLETLEFGLFGVVVFGAEGVVLNLLLVTLFPVEISSRMVVEEWGERTLCFSRIPHFSRPSSWPRSRCCRLWTALRMEDIL